MKIAQYLEFYLLEAEGKTMLLRPERGTVENAVLAIGANPNDKIIYDDTMPEPLKVPDNPAEGTRVISALEGNTYVSVFVDGTWYTESWKGIDKAFPSHNYLYDVPAVFYADEEILEILEPFEPGVITKQWKVGDVVPALTKVGRAWVGRAEGGAIFRDSYQTSMYDRTIEWIDS